MTPDELLDILWILLCAGFVFLMQGGFLCLESGVTRTKNSVNVAFKNIVDFGLSVLLYWALSYGLMFGDSAGGWIGFSGFFYHITGEGAPFQYSVFIFQAMFCATGATIISGATAERLRFYSYLIITAVFSILVYPFIGHWVWATDLLGEPAGWLAQQGFVDFAGSSVVHSAGGWVSLAILLLVGPRTGRFDPQWKPVTIPGSNMPLAMLGTTLLVFGWFGFNGGSALSFTDGVPLILMNTLMGAVSGMGAVLLLMPITKDLPDPGLVMNGAIAGLVAVTANCHVTGPFAAVLIGGTGGAIMLGTMKLLERLRIDDAVGAIPAHLAPGIWGTVAVAFFATPELMGVESIDRGALFGAQLMGVVTIGLWAFGLSYLLFYLLQKVVPFRVSTDSEAQGLNVSEHGVRTETLFLLQDMERHAATGDLSDRVSVEPFTEVGQIARQYNKVIDSLDMTMSRLQSIFRDLNDGLITFTQDCLITHINPAACDFYGLEPATATGMSAWDLLVPNAREDLEVKQPAELDPFDPFKTGSLQELRYTRRNSRKDQIVEFLASKGMFKDEVVFTGLIRDITETVQTHRNQSRLINKLHGAQQSNFFAEMCRQSLPALGHLAERIKVQSEKKASLSSSSSAEVGMKLVSEDARDIFALTNDLMYLDEQGALPLEPANLPELVKSTIATVISDESTSELKGATIMGNIEDSALKAILAPGPFEQVFETLLKAAYRECPPDLNILVTCTGAYLDHPYTGADVIPAGDYQVVTILDNGFGMDEEDLDAFFEVMSKRHSDLDMVLVDSILSSMGGFFDVDSAVGEGITTKIYLPVFRELPLLHDVETYKGKVLVLDDSPEQRKWIGAQLFSEEYLVFEAASGEDALSILEVETVDVLILDLVLHKDAHPTDTVFRQIHDAFPELPILASCGQGDSHVLTSILEEGAAGHLKKPIEAWSLKHLVKKQILSRT